MAGLTISKTKQLKHFQHPNSWVCVLYALRFAILPRVTDPMDRIKWEFCNKRLAWHFFPANHLAAPVFHTAKSHRSLTHEARR